MTKSDIFVSYTSTDRAWAHWIAHELAALGHIPHVHEWEIGKGENILGWMSARHGGADHVLCVMSDAYLKAGYSTLEREAAEWRAVEEKRPGFMLYVVVAPCVLPPLAQHFKRCELYGLPDDAARQRFHAFMAAPAPPLAVAFPRQDIAAESNISIAVPRIFMGRDDDMATIEATLKRYHGRAAITALRGMRGVGKTVLAAAYAAKHRHDYRATWWLRAETADGIRTDLVALGHRLGWVADGEAQDATLAKVADRLRREGEGILLIFDNALDADSIRPFLPLDSAAHVLITSNAHRWGDVAEAVEIRLWPTDIGADYLLKRTGSADKPAAEALSAALDGLPLAHDMAAAYCEELGLSLAAYLARFTASPAEVLDDAESAPAGYHDRLTAAKAFALAIEEAAKRHPAAEPLLVAAAMLPPEPVPLFLFSEGRWALAEGLGKNLEGRGIDRAVAALRRFALVEVESIPDERDPAITTETIRLHRLIRMATHWRRDSAATTAIQRGLFAAFVAAYPKTVFEPQSWPRCRRLDPIATALLSPDNEPSASAGIQFANVLIGVGQYRKQAAAYRAARPLFERALAINERLRGADHPQTGVAVASLAWLLQAQGDLAAARPLFERDLAITEKALGAEHPDTATSLANLAGLLQAQGDLAAARPLFERALGINEKVLGAEHPDTATSLNNLALLLRDQGDLAAARPLFERALGIYEKVLGAEHPNTGIVLRALAGVRRAQGEAAAALPLFERALAIEVAAFGATAPRAAHARNELALTLLVLRRAPAADALLAETARTLVTPTAIVTPGTAFLALLSAATQATPPEDPLGRLKTLLLGPALPRAEGVPHIWRAREAVAMLAKALPDPWPEMAPALLAAINDPAEAPALDRFPLWHAAAG